MPLNPTKGLKAADENDEHIIRQVSTAELMVGMGQVSDAVTMLRQLLQERPENIQVRIKLKDIYLRSEMLNEAAQECLQLARIYEARGDSNRATDYLVRARRLNPAMESKTNEEPLHASAAREVTGAATDDSTARVSLKKVEAEAPPIVVELNPAREHAEKEARPAAKVEPPPAALIKEPPVKEAVLVKEKAPVKEGVLVKEIVRPAPPVVVVEQAFVTNETALAPLAESKVTTKKETGPVVALATRAETDTSLIVKPISILRTSPTNRRQSRWLKFSAIAAACLAILSSAAIGGLSAYDRYLDRQYAALVPVDLKQAPPSLPEAYTEAMAAEQQQLVPDEQIEAVTITAPTPDLADRYEEEPEREIIKPAPLPEPTITSPPPKESKPPSPAPPMIGRVNAGQGGFSNGAASLAPGGLPLTDSPPPPPQMVRKSTGVVRGRVLKRVEPTNPTTALSRLTGTVIVEVLIDERGNVASARALSGNPVLQNSALSAARRWKFEPSTLNGTAVQAMGQITFNFK